MNHVCASKLKEAYLCFKVKWSIFVRPGSHSLKLLRLGW